MFHWYIDLGLNTVTTFRLKFILKLCLMIVFCLFHTRCLSIGFLNLGSLVLGNNIVASATAEGVSDTESELLAEGPIELPVTIAKLESPDASKLEISESFGGANLVDERALYQVAPRILIITGLPEAIRDVEDQPYVVGFPYEQIESVVGEQVTVNVEDDGSFTMTVPTEGDALLASGNGAFVSPFLHITEDPVTGYFTIITTNSAPGVIDTDTQVAVDSDGYYYLNFNDAVTGGQSLVRRNVDGSLVQEIVSGDGIEIDSLVVRTSNKGVYTYQNSETTGSLTLQLTSIVQDASASVSELVDDELFQFSRIVSFNYELADILNYDSSSNNHRIYINSDEDGVVFLNRSDPSVVYVNTTSTDTLNVIRDGLYDDIRIALDIENNILYAWILDEGLYSLYSTDIANDPSFAWGQRESLMVFQEYEDIVSMDAAHGVLSYSIQNEGQLEWYAYTENEGVFAINDPGDDDGVYENIKVSLDGSAIFACETSGEINQFVYYKLSDGEIRSVTGDPSVEVCTGNESSYYVAEDFVHFYRNGQHAMINIDQLE